MAELLESATKKLDSAGIENSLLESELILSFVTNRNVGELRAAVILNKGLTADEAQNAMMIIEQRAQRVPLQHLTGLAAFRGIELEVGPGVFVPRPETEIVTQFAIDELLADASEEPVMIDFCTGSGAIALAVATEVLQARIWAVELEEEAYGWAKRNVARLGNDRVELVNADVTKEIPELAHLRGMASVVISNPPYVPTGAVPRDAEVRDHDPQSALYSGADGLDMIRVLSKKAKPFLRLGGLFVLEHAEHQGASVRKILGEDGWKNVTTHQDMTRRDRATIARS